MSRVKVITAVFIAVVALSAVASASALAGWFVSGSALTSGTKALKTKAIVDEAAILNTPSLSLKITCAGLSGSGPELVGGTSRAQAASLTFEACTVIEPAACSISPTNVVTEAIYGLLTLGSGSDEDKVLFEPQSGKTFANFKLEGATCAINGEKLVQGTVVARAPVGQLERTEQVLEGLGSTEQGSDELQVAKNKAFLEKGKALLLLASGEAWSFK